MFSEAHWIGYRYELFKDNKDKRMNAFKEKVIREFNSLPESLRKEAEKGIQYAIDERERILGINEQENNDSRREVILGMFKKGLDMHQIAKSLNICYGTVAKFRNELISLGKLDKSIKHFRSSSLGSNPEIVKKIIDGSLLGKTAKEIAKELGVSESPCMKLRLKLIRKGLIPSIDEIRRIRRNNKKLVKVK